MKDCENYIFDLYGTLVDVETDENQPYMWEFLAQVYGSYGCDWDVDELKQAYCEKVQEEEKALREKSGYDFPEIRLERVFARLLFEAPARHSSSACIAGKNMDQLYEWYSEKREEVIAEIMKSEWVYLLANQFRISSRLRLKPYKNTFRVLEQLKAAGKKIYLLSNAQYMFTMPELEITGLLPCFDAFYISSDAGIKKPQPEYMYKLLQEQGLSVKDCVMVGNEIRSDIKIAVKCGMDSIFLNTFELTEEEIEEQMSALFKEAEADGQNPELMKRPEIILSGEIGELI